MNKVQSTLPMQIEVTFGLSLDGAAGQGEDGLGKLRVGPSGLLGFLELHTGLSRKSFSHVERVSAFLGVLNESHTSIPSFSASFSVDPLATAQRLLGWLDAWQLHGWNGSLLEDAPARLRELALVAHRGRGRVPPSEGERLDAIRSALQNGSRVPLSSIGLCEGLDAYPAGWKRVLEYLPHQPIQFKAGAEPSSDLGKLQRVLAGGTAEHFSNDGSLKVYRARTNLGAARFLAGGSGPAAGGASADEMILVGGSGSLWDEACVSQGVPRPAAFGWNTPRPALQVLPLALALHRDPLDVEALLAFLTHPICPLGWERRFFAEAVAADGGLGGPQWGRARQRALESYARYDKDPKRLDELLAEWIPDERHGGETLPLELLRSTAKGVRRYLSARSAAMENGAEAEKAVLADAIGQCSLFERTLGLLGQSFENVPVNLANGLLAAATQAFGARHDGRRELGASAWVEDPGAIIDPVGKLTWLLPARPESPEPWPWSAREIAALSSCGMELPRLSDLNARITQDWIRAVSLATDCLELILPPEGREAHPLALLISSIRPGLEEGFEEDMEAAALAGTGSPLARLAPVSTIRLPASKRWWKVPRSLSPEPGWQASYSQINTLLRRPAQWVLEHKARIRTSAILSVPDRATLAGTFAHALVQRCIETFGARATRLSETEFAAWYDTAFESLLASQGARWLEPGAAQEQLRLRESLRTSIGALLSQLRAANAVTLESENALEGTLFGIPFKGSADIVLKNGFNRNAIIDMKNSHWLDGHRDMLEKDTDIQLTIYAELYRQGSGAEAEAVYYLIPKERLLARDPSMFPLAELVANASTHAQRLGMIGTSFEWRRRQLDEGSIEVVCEATEELGAPAEAPEGGLPLEEAFDLYDAYLGIYGWSDTE